MLKYIEKRFEEKNWGGQELRKIEVLLEGDINEDAIKERVSKLFCHLEEHPPSDRIKRA